MRLRAVLAGVAMLALAGCGGSSDAIRVWRAQAARVCTRALVREARIEAPAVPARTAGFLRRGLAVLRAELAGLRALRAPSEQAGARAAAVEALGREVAILTATLDHLDRGADPLPTIKTLQHRLAPVEADGRAAWRTLDVPACINP